MTTSASSGSLRRPRVADLIRAALGRGTIALLIAPPGYGKTTALRDCLHDDPLVRWIEIPAGARLEDVVRVLTAGTVPEHLASVAALFDGSGNPKDFERTVEWMTRRLRLFEGTLVIDDLHRCLGDGSAVRFFARVVERTVAHVRWCMASREVPDLPIGSWVARGLMALPITDAELAFTHDEAADLARAREVDVDASTLAAIVRDAGGWPMAIHVALQLWARTRSIGPLQIRTREVLFSQIESELWPAVAADVREVIFACALLPEASSDVLDAAGFRGAEALLERAHHAIPFVQRTVEGGYVLHDLFADYIHATLRRHPDELRALRERLATGLLARARTADALDVLVAGGDRARILAVLADAGFPLVERGHRASVARALTFLSDTGDRNHPIVVALRGVLSHADGSPGNAEALYSFAYDGGLPPTMRRETGRRLATAYFNRGEGARAVEILEALLSDAAIGDSDDAEMRGNLAMALAMVGRADDARATLAAVLERSAALAPEPRARVLQRLGVTAYYLGDLGRAAAFARDAAQLAATLNLWACAGHAHCLLYSITSLVESDSSIPLAHARLALAAGERAGESGLVAFGVRGEYMLHAFRGDERAFEAAEQRMARLHDVRTFRTSFPARYARALAETIRGNVRKAISTLGVVDAHELSPAEDALREAMLALLYFLADRPHESDALLKAPFALEAQGDFVSRRYVNLARITRGMALWCHDRTALARRMFRFDEDAVAENDRVLLTTVGGICSSSRRLVPPETLEEGLARLRAYGWGGYGRLIEMMLANVEPETTLTPAEIKTLRAFRHGANTVQVAGDLGKSPHTIEAQLKSAYKKIGCVSRAEALTYARARGWLDEPVLDRTRRAGHT